MSDEAVKAKMGPIEIHHSSTYSVLAKHPNWICSNQDLVKVRNFVPSGDDPFNFFYRRSLPLFIAGRYGSRHPFTALCPSLFTPASVWNFVDRANPEKPLKVEFFCSHSISAVLTLTTTNVLHRSTSTAAHSFAELELLRRVLDELWRSSSRTRISSGLDKQTPLSLGRVCS